MQKIEIINNKNIIKTWSFFSGKGPKYRFLLPIDFKSFREEITGKNFVIAGVNESMLNLMP